MEVEFQELNKQKVQSACNNVIDLLEKQLKLNDIEKYAVMEMLWETFPNKDQYALIYLQHKDKRQ